ncbi:MAG: T9SS type A sorting domain-containing protein [Bacteroidota bacterium]
MNVTGAFTINQQAGNDNGIFLNAAAGTTSQLNIGGDFTLSHTGGNDFELETNGVSSQVNITGNFNTTWTSSDGDLYYLDLNDGLLGVGQNYSVNQTASGGTTEDITIRLDAAAQMNVTGSYTITQAAGNDVTIMLNSTAGTTAQINIGGTFTETHSGGDDFEIELDGSSLVTIGGNMITTWNSSDGDDYFIDVNGGILTVTGNYTYTQPAPGGTTEDCDIRIDGSGKFVVSGATGITQNSGGQVIFYLNNLAGTTSQFNGGGNFTITHGTAAAGVYLEANQTSVFSVGGNFLLDNAASGGDLARFRLNNTPTVTITGNYTMNNTSGSTLTTDNVELDINGGTMSVGGTLTMNESGGNDAILTLDGTCSLAVTGTLSLTHSGGDDNYITLGASSGSPTVTAGALILNDNGGDITYCRLYGASVMTVAGNVTLTSAAATQNDIGVYSTSQFKIGGNFMRAASPSRYGVLSSAATATVEYNGSSLQTIAGDAGSSGDAFTYGNVKLNNAAGFQMTAAEGVATIPNTSTLNFTNGIVNSVSTAYFIIASGGLVSNASDISYVDGPIRKVGNSAFTFPVGDNNNYQPIGISAPTNAAHHFTAQYISVDPGVTYDRTSKDASLNHISGCEYWLLDRTGGASSVTVTLNWDAGSCGVDDLPTMQVAQWDGAVWRNRGQGGRSGTTTAGSLYTTSTLGTFTSPSPFTLSSSSGNNPLPVELVKFGVKPENEKAKLFWTTASEKDNDYFEIERSGDGVHFTAIGQVKGAGNSVSMLNYTWYDLKPLSGLSYYRLKQVDNNGDYNYSAIQTCLFNGKNTDKSFTLYPNPNTGDKIFISFNADQFNKNISVDIFDVNGVSVFSDLTVTTDASGRNAMLNIPGNLPKGVYVVSLHNSENSEKQLLVIN